MTTRFDMMHEVIKHLNDSLLIRCYTVKPHNDYGFLVVGDWGTITKTVIEMVESKGHELVSVSVSNGSIQAFFAYRREDLE